MTQDSAQSPRPTPPSARSRLPSTAHRGVWLMVVGMSALVGLAYATVLPIVSREVGERPLVVPLWVLVIAFVLTERSLVWMRAGTSQGLSLTLSDLPLTVGLFLADPLTLLLARLAGTAAGSVVQGQLNPHKDAFNLANHAVGVMAALVTWHLVLGGAPLLGPRGWLAAVAAVLVAETLNAVCIFLVIWVDTGQRDAGTLHMGWGEVVAAASACFGLVFVYVLSVDWRAGWLVVVVTLVLYVAHRSYGGLQRRSAAVETMSAFTGRIGGHQDAATVIEDSLQTITLALRAEVAELQIDDPTSTRPVVWRLDRRPVTGAVTEPVTTEVPAADSFLGRLGPRDTPVIVAHHLLAFWSGPPRLAGLRDLIAVPVVHEGTAIGTALVANRVGDARAFDQVDKTQLEALANHTATALGNARLNQDLRESLVQREHQATHDELTGLPNRRAFVARLEQRCEKGQPSVVAILDIDHFHDVNDVLGSGTGDLLLNLVASRIVSLFGSDQVARLSADEFAVVLDGAAADHVRTCTRARLRVQEPVRYGGLDLSPEVSIGLADVQADAPASSALARADLALRRARTARAGVVAYDPAQDRATEDRLTLLPDLRRAVHDGSLLVHFQPQVRLEDSTVVGFEALVRWPHPQRGLIPPDEFIQLAEQGGLMMPLTLHVLDESLRHLGAWRRGVDGTGPRDLGVSVNVSPRTLMDPYLLAQTEVLLAHHDVPASRLTLEITESDIMSEPERAATALQRFSDLGVRLSVDDLGTGYSSLSYLSRFPLDELKIDKSFILQLIGDQATEAVVEAMIGLGRRLGRVVVAEGVEDLPTLTYLANNGCSIAQGFYLSRPLGPDAVPGWISSWAGHPAHGPAAGPGAARAREVVRARG